MASCARPSRMPRRRLHLLSGVVATATAVSWAAAALAAQPAPAPATLPAGPGTLAIRMNQAMTWPDRFSALVDLAVVTPAQQPAGAASDGRVSLELRGFPPDAFAWAPTQTDQVVPGVAWRGMVQLQRAGPGPRFAYSYAGLPFLEVMRLFLAVFRPLPEGSRLELGAERRVAGRTAVEAILTEAVTGQRAQLTVDVQTGLILEASALVSGRSAQTLVRAVRFDSGGARTAVEFEAPALGQSGRLVLVRLPSGHWFPSEAVLGEQPAQRVVFHQVKLGGEAGEISPPDVSALRHIASSMAKAEEALRSKHHSAAVEHFREAVRIDPYYVDAYNRLGSAAMEAGDWVTAASSFDEVIHLAPSAPYGYNNLAYLYAEAQINLSQALRLASRAMDLAGPDPPASILDTYGWVLFRHERLQEATQFLERAVAGSGDDPESQAEILYHLAEVQARLGKLDEARSLLTRALELSPDLAEARQALGRLGPSESVPGAP